MKKTYMPKGYYLQDGCWNCDGVLREAVASDIYPFCKAYYKIFQVNNYGKCKRWQHYKRGVSTNASGEDK